MTGQHPVFYTDSDRVKKALRTAPQYLTYLKSKNKISDECFEVMSSLLDFNKSNRMTADELLNHPFFTSKTKKGPKIKPKKNIKVFDMERE